MGPKKELSRQSIIDTALSLAAREGVAGLTMGKVAKAAGLTRQAVYWHFGSRLALLEEMLAVFDAGYAERETMYEGAAEGSALDRLVAMMRAWLAQLPDHATLLLALHDAALTDAEAAKVYRDRVRGISAAMRAVYLDRLAAEGFLRPGVDLSEAADFMATLGSPAVWREMSTMFGWSHAQFSRFVVDTVLSRILRSERLPADVGMA